MTPNELISDIHSFCQANANEEMVKKYSRYFKGGFIGYGIDQKETQQKVNELNENPAITFDLLFKAAPELLQTLKYEETIIILSIINKRHKQFDKEVFQHIEKLYDFGIQNWAHADLLGMAILPVFLLKGIVKPDDFKSWITSSHKFKRRCVPVTLIKIIKENKTADFTVYFKLIEPLMSDPEREVHQGTGWFLREAWKIQPETTEKFLYKYKDTAPRLIFQYACEKMTKENKERFKKSK